MSLSTILTQVCRRIGITAPTSFVASQDPQIQQLIGLANEEGQELSARYPWGGITIEKTFSTVATESQGAITTLAGSDFRYILNDIMWNRSLLRPVFGPISPQYWQELKARSITGPWAQFRIRGGNVLFIPAPVVGNTVAFEYVSKNWVTVAAGGTAAAWSADADTGLLDEEIMAFGVIWRWKQVKGLSYAEDFNKYEGVVNDQMARDGGKPMLNLNGDGGSYPAGTIVPIGSWPL